MGSPECHNQPLSDNWARGRAAIAMLALTATLTGCGGGVAALDETPRSTAITGPAQVTPDCTFLPALMPKPPSARGSFGDAQIAPAAGCVTPVYDWQNVSRPVGEIAPGRMIDVDCTAVDPVSGARLLRLVYLARIGQEVSAVAFVSPETFAFVSEPGPCI